MEQQDPSIGGVVVVMVPLPAQGHLNQLLHLTRIISTRGVPVHYVGAATHNRQAKERSQGWAPSSTSNLHFFDVKLPSFATPPPDPNAVSKYPSHLLPTFYATFNLREPLGELLRSLSASYKRVVVIHDSLMAFAAEEASLVSNAEAYGFVACSAFAVLRFIWDFLGEPADEGAATLGVAYGRVADNLPPAREVVDLYKSQGIKGMRIYAPNQDVLQALKGSHIQLVLGVANGHLQQLALNTSSARRWVQTNVVNYWPDVRIKYIAVGNEVTPVNHNSRYAPFVVPAMRNIFNAIRDAGLFRKVIVTTSLDTTVIGTSYPPSAGEFRSDVMWFMNPLIAFLINTRAPYMTSVYPFFAYTSDPNIKLSYALFTNKRPEFIDNNLKYYNLFDAILDGVHSALDRVSGSRLVGVHSALDGVSGSSPEVVNGETGWSASDKHSPVPSPPGRHLLYSDHAPSISHACTYNQNLIRHVTSGNGTPKRPGVSIETYIFAMFNENLKTGPATEKHFGLFYPNKKPVCKFNFSGT